MGRSTDIPGPGMAKARARYESLMTLLVVLLIVVVLVSLALIAWQGFTIRDNQDQIKALVRSQQTQARQVKEVLDRQTANDKRRQALINDAVNAIAAEQYRALVAHDRRTEELLRRSARLLDQEVNAPANQEQRMLTPIPRPMLAPARQAAPPPQVGPPTGVAPAPAPQPAPAPCQQRGKSGKCRK